jgi:hypothetical protein
MSALIFLFCSATAANGKHIITIVKSYILDKEYITERGNAFIPVTFMYHIIDLKLAAHNVNEGYLYNLVFMGRFFDQQSFPIINFRLCHKMVL